MGKLSDESLDSLVAELEKVSDAAEVDGEGEAARLVSRNFHEFPSLQNSSKIQLKN